LKITREIKTAILVISSLLLFIWGYSYLKGKDILETYKTIYVHYESVEGLPPSAMVTFNGLSIGKVEKIEYDANKGKMLVTIIIKGNFPISKSSLAIMYEPGFIGGKQIMIIPDHTDSNVIEDESFLKGEIKPGLTSELSEKLVPLQQKIEHMVVNADSLLQKINFVLDAKTQTQIKQSITSLNATLAEFSKVSQSTNELMDKNKDKLSNTFSNLEKTSANFEKLSDSLVNANIGNSIRTMEKTLVQANKLLSELNEGKGSMGMLLKDDKMYKNLEGATRELEALLKDMKERPKRYVHFSLFGKKETPFQEIKK
jgi:phospholipid/cholesterol/gamma-HCH transport system substrate-binding protein